MASRTFCLDSDIIIWHLRAAQPFDVPAYLSALATKGTLVTTAISVAEVEQGVRAGEAERTRRLLRSLPTIEINRGIAEHAGEIVRTLRSKGETLGLADALIAACCLANDAVLVTLNMKRFSKIPSLEIELVP
jgi:predicted nucleic acid-binding protein